MGSPTAAPGGSVQLIKSYFRLAESGIDADCRAPKARRIRLLNTLGLVMFVVCLPYIPLFAAVGLTALALAVVPISLVDLAVPFVAKKSANAARLMFFTNWNISMFVYASFMGRDAGIQLMLFSGACFPLLVTDLKERGVIAYGVGGAVASYVALMATGWQAFGPPILDARFEQLIYVPLVLTTFFMLTLAMVYFAWLNDQAAARLDKRNSELQLVLDAIDQGIIGVHREGGLCDERSLRADQWLHSAAGGTPFVDLLQQQDPDVADMWALGWETLLDDILPVALSIDQMPKRIHLDGTPIELAYQPLYEDGPDAPFTRVMVLMSDISAALDAERAERAAREDMALFKAASDDRNGVRRFVEEARRMVDALCSDDLSTDDEKRLLHTLKGNCGQFGVVTVAALTHDLETRLDQTGDPLQDADKAELRQTWTTLDDRVAAFVFVEDEAGLQVDATEVVDVARALIATEPAIAQRLLSWRHAPAERVLQRLHRQGNALMQRLDGRDLDVVVEHNHLRLDEDHLQTFLASLTHVVRNCVDHGLRPLPHTTTPQLVLRAEEHDGRLRISVRDNGGGIDWEALRHKAREQGLAHETQDDLVAALFADGITTRDVVTEFSGRGVGMAAVKQALDALGGTATVASAPGEGTTFQFEMPISAANDAVNDDGLASGDVRERASGGR